MNYKQAAVALLKGFEAGEARVLDVVSSAKYIRHHPDFAEGPQGLRDFLKQIPPGTVKVNPVRVFQDGDYVFTHSEYDWSGPKTGFDIFRFEAGKIVEHWDNLQETPAQLNPSGRTMIDGPVAARDFDRTEANKQLVRAYIEDTFIYGRLDKFAGYFLDDQYLQHNPRRGDGGSTLGDALKVMAAKGAPLKFDHLHLLLGEGDFVLAANEGTFGGRHLAFFDFYRVADGKIAEHWDVVQVIPKKGLWKNSHGKF